MALPAVALTAIRARQCDSIVPSGGGRLDDDVLGVLAPM